MLDKMISKQVFEQPELGKLIFAQAQQEVGKREKVGDELKNTVAAAAAVRGFMPAKNTQVAEAQVNAMRDAYVSYRRSGSQADLDLYTNVKNDLLSNLAVGKARYDNAASARQKAYEDGFAGVLGGRENVDGQWSNVMESKFESVQYDNSGNLLVSENGQAAPWQSTAYSDVKNINPGVSDYVLQRESEVPTLAIPSEASANYRNLLNVEDDDSWEDVSKRLYGQMNIDKDSREYREAAAIYYYRDVLKRAKDNRQLSPSEKRDAIETYANSEKGFEAAWRAYTSDISNRLEKEYGRDPDGDGDYFKNLNAEQKKILDRPLNIHKRTQMMLPNGQTADLDQYSMDLKALDISYDKAEGQKVKDVYFNADGTLDHFVIRVPAKKIADGTMMNVLDLDEITIDGKAIDGKNLTDAEKIAAWADLTKTQAAQKKYVTIRIYDPREMANTLGETVTGIIQQKVLFATGAQAARKMESEEGYGSTVASGVPMTD
jgi:hypothetical protein